jgi:Caspase domain
MFVTELVRGPHRRCSRRLLSLFVVLGLLTICLPAQAERYALVVGIDKYPHVNQLQGCVQDVRDYHSLLTGQYGFADANVTVLTDAAATREEILRALDRMGQRVHSGDTFVFVYSGHGTLFPDEKSEEIDETELLPKTDYFPAGHYDSAICPFDTGGESTSGKPWRNLILDDELFDHFQPFTTRGCFVLLMSDSCFSGSLARDVGKHLVRGLTPEKALGIPLSAIPRPARSRDVGWRDMSGLYLAITSATDTQTSSEWVDDEGHHCGLFTYALRKALAGRGEGARTYKQVFDNVHTTVLSLSQKDGGSRQEPQVDTRYYTAGLDAAMFDRPAGAASVAAGSLRVVVRVTDASGNPLPDAFFCVFRPGIVDRAAKISPADTLLLGKTDRRGIFDSDQLSVRIPAGAYRVKVVRDGYAVFDDQRELREGSQAGTAVLSFKLVNQ